MKKEFKELQEFRSSGVPENAHLRSSPGLGENISKRNQNSDFYDCTEQILNSCNSLNSSNSF
jgi:hypothetical protein